MNPEKFYWDTCGINVECASFFPRFEKSEIFGLSIPPFPCKLSSAAFCCLKHGTHSSAVEHQIVVLRVVGSNPTEYPKNQVLASVRSWACFLWLLETHEEWVE